MVGKKLVGPNSTAVATDSDEDAGGRPLSAEKYVLVSGSRPPDWASKWGQEYFEMRRDWENKRIHKIENSRDKPTFKDWFEENPDKARSLQEDVKRRLARPSQARKWAESSIARTEKREDQRKT